MERAKALTGDESGIFASPKPQELMGLSMKIQKGVENNWIGETIEKNPRILCTSSDAPTILQEGARYNALHIAGRWGNSEAAILILSAVSSKSFMTKLYPDDDEQIRKDRTFYLSDLYLNTPDKLALETPLHLACKFNCYEVAKVLISHPLCDLGRKNHEGKLAKNIIGTRASKDTKQLTRKIQKLFQDDKIVPIWRDPDCDQQPVVGRVVNPKNLGNFTPLPFYEHFDGIDLDLYTPVDWTAIPPPLLGVQKVIKAFAGPMGDNQAKEFYERMTHSGKYYGASLSRSFSQNLTSVSPGTTPTGKSARNSSSSDNFSTPKNQIRTRPEVTPICTKTPKHLSKDQGSTPRSFLNISDLLSPNKSQYNLQMAQDRRIRLEDPERGLERIGRRYACELDIPFYEYWRFANKFLDLSSSEGLALAQLESRVLDREKDINQVVPAKTEGHVSHICDDLNNWNLKSDSNPESLNTTKSSDK